MSFENIAPRLVRIESEWETNGRLADKNDVEWLYIVANRVRYLWTVPELIGMLKQRIAEDVTERITQ